MPTDQLLYCSEAENESKLHRKIAVPQDITWLELSFVAMVLL